VTKEALGSSSRCRHCHSELTLSFLDLGSAPPSNSYLSTDHLWRPEITLPLRLLVCETCWLVQTQDFAAPTDYFSSDYAYFSSTSTSWLEHSRRYAVDITDRLSLGPASLVIEVASNDGYLLRNFVEAGIPCLGIEPTDGTADVAEALGIPVLREFFGQSLAEQLASEGRSADLIIGNNVYAHVPDINDFTAGIREALRPDGVVTLEFPHLMRLVEFAQFDTVYHEHFSYLSLGTVSRIFAEAGLRIFDVDELSTHGGSLRIYGCHDDSGHDTSPRVQKILDEEQQRGMSTSRYYSEFQARAEAVKDGLLTFLLAEKNAGRLVAGYGAAAKGNTLLNFAGVRRDLLGFVCDAAPSKQGKFLPGSRIPILAPSALAVERPDAIMILPWNLAHEVVAQLDFAREWGARFVTAVPSIRAHE
jgi:SAM-dependent methyltransferase